MEKAKRKCREASKAKQHQVRKHESKQRIRELNGMRAEYLKTHLVLSSVLEMQEIRDAEEEPKEGKSKLTLYERQRIYLLSERGCGVNAIARDIGRHPSTVSRELRRNKPKIRVLGLDSYSRARQADDLAKERKRKSRNGRIRLKSYAIQALVYDAIYHLGWSPDKVSKRLLLEHGIRISHEAIYQWIYEVERTLINHLYRQGRKYRRNSQKRSRAKPTPAIPKVSIEQRSKAANERTEIGHWEVDTIVSRQSKACLLVLIERSTRFFFVRKLSSCCAEEASKTVIELLGGLEKKYVKSLTCDNGSENWGYDKIKAALGIEVYFCHPYTSSERGTVENRNGVLRRIFPKKTNFELVSEAEIQRAWERIINTPMKCLSYYTPREVFLGVYEPMLKLAA